MNLCSVLCVWATSIHAVLLLATLCFCCQPKQRRKRLYERQCSFEWRLENMCLVTKCCSARSNKCLQNQSHHTRCFRTPLRGCCFQWTLPTNMPSICHCPSLTRPGATLVENHGHKVCVDRKLEGCDQSYVRPCDVKRCQASLDQVLKTCGHSRSCHSSFRHRVQFL